MFINIFLILRNPIICVLLISIIYVMYFYRLFASQCCLILTELFLRDLFSLNNVNCIFVLFFISIHYATYYHYTYTRRRKYINRMLIYLFFLVHIYFWLHSVVLRQPFKVIQPCSLPKADLPEWKRKQITWDSENVFFNSRGKICETVASNACDPISNKKSLKTTRQSTGKWDFQSGQ